MNRNKYIYPGITAAVLGLGVSGRSAVHYALSCGADVLVSDTRDVKRFSVEEAGFLEDTAVGWEAGGHTLEFLAQADLVIVSPGVDLSSPLLEKIKQRDVRIMGELALVAGNFEVPLIAVTGTNGKTTVTSMIGEVLQKSGRKVFVGGNIGTPLFDFFLTPMDSDIVVAEVSSFQLENCGKFSPDIAILLNITPDHLDRHGTIGNYIKAKMNIFAHQNDSQIAIVNGDDDFCRHLDPDVPSTLRSFGTKKYNSLVIDGGRLVASGGDGCADIFPSLDDVSGFTAENYAAAALALQAVGVSPTVIEKGILDFETLPHRLEYVGTREGVRYYNDSKATNTGAVLAALEQFDVPVVLIAGGRDKGDDFTLLRDAVAEKVRALVVIGEAAGIIEEALGKGVLIIHAFSMTEAVKVASGLAASGDVVLLSPACASFDMFSSYGHRGDTFKEAVAAIIEN